MAVSVVENLPAYSLNLGNNPSGLRNGVDGRTTDNAAGDWELRTGSNKESIHLSSTLTTFIYSPENAVSKRNLQK